MEDITEIAKQTAHLLAKQWMASPQDEREMMISIREALMGPKADKAKEYIREIYANKAFIPRKPAPFLATALRNPKPRSEAKEAKPTEPDIQAEIAEEEGFYQREPIESNEIYAFLGGGEFHWLEPGEPHPEMNEDEYIQNTFISVRREAKARGASMHQICREKGLSYDCLVTGRGR